MLLEVQKVSCLAEGINSYELVDPSGRQLPEFDAGAHVDLHLGNGLIRQYSLCGDPVERTKYTIGVLNDPSGRGGSRYLHDHVRVGSRIEVSAPRNNFRLVAAERYVFIAGGIGITPIISMLRVLRGRACDVRLYYCTRSPARTAFQEEVYTLCAEGRAVIHYDGGIPDQGLGFHEILVDWQDGTHLYYCGPAGFIAAVGRAASYWPASHVHCEHFSAPARQAAPNDVDRPFRIRISGSGDEYDVPQGESIVSVLRRHGVPVETSCEDGYCGTCMTRYVGGEPDHRDTVLDEETRRQYLLICCSRAKTPILDLDI